MNLRCGYGEHTVGIRGDPLVRWGLSRISVIANRLVYSA